MMNAQRDGSLHKKNWVELILWIIFLEVIGFGLGYLTQGSIHSWYDGLNKSTLNPPPVLFAIVWPILYALLGVVGWSIWHLRDNPYRQPALWFYAIQLIMNWAWTPLFFQLHWTGFALGWIIMLVYMTIAAIYFIYLQNIWLSMLLVPYLIWLLFATYLNGVIWLLN